MTPDRLDEQRIVVESAINRKFLDKYSGVLISGDNKKIVRALTGEFKNTHNSVFKKCLGKTSCEHCGDVGELDRAHTRSRLDIAEEVLNELHPDPSVPIDIKTFMVAFILRHRTIGVWMLCKKCHKELG